MRTTHSRLAGYLWAVLIFPLAAAAASYDPLDVKNREAGRPLDFTLEDDDRDRQVPIRVFLPEKKAAAPVVLFSHGLGGTRKTCNYLGQHWSARGYAVVFLQHPGSDDSVWKDEPVLKRMAALKQAASLKNFLRRVEDVDFVLDELEKLQQDEDHPLAGRLDLTHVGMSGHSFGAVTTQAVSGQTTLLGKQQFTDSRIQAAIAFSPSSPRRGKPEQAFGKVKIPWLLMTGTEDTAPIGGQTVESRQAVFPALPAGDKYQLVLHQAEHSAFTERPLPGDREKRNPNHHRAILAISTAFWDAYLQDQSDARQWLSGAGPRRVLEEKDVWEKK